MNLLPCPYCGKQAEFRENREIDPEGEASCPGDNCPGAELWIQVRIWNRGSIDFDNLKSAYDQFKTSLIAQEETNAHLRNLCRMLIAKMKGTRDETPLSEMSELLKQIEEAVKL